MRDSLQHLSRIGLTVQAIIAGTILAISGGRGRSSHGKFWIALFFQAVVPTNGPLCFPFWWA